MLFSGGGKPQRYRALFISDLHMGKRKTMVAALISSLMMTDADKIYLVGDIFDIWKWERRWHWVPEYDLLLNVLFMKQDQGCEIIYLPGNHDIEFRDIIDGYPALHKRLSEILGWTIQSEVFHKTRTGDQYLVLHGDQFDSALVSGLSRGADGFWRYLSEELLFREREAKIIEDDFHAHHFSISYVFKASLYEYAKEHHVTPSKLDLNRLFRRLPRKVIDKGDSFMVLFSKLKTCVYEMVQSIENESINGVIYGHTHLPGKVEFKNLNLLNTGDWVKRGTLLAEDQKGRLKLCTHKDFWCKNKSPIDRFARDTAQVVFDPRTTFMKQVLEVLSQSDVETSERIMDVQDLCADFGVEDEETGRIYRPA